VVGLAIFWPLTNMVNVLGAMVQEAISGVAPSKLAHGLLPTLVEAGPGPWTWGIVAAVIVGPALVEEILYRGLLQESIRRSGLGRTRGAWAAISLSSCVFVLMHVGSVDLHALGALFVLSMGFGWAFARTGRLAASVTMHLLFNAGNLLFAVPWIIG
jgi:membrane protease YdiL (CAAX protease family)